jgi:hypothetical protein
MVENCEGILFVTLLCSSFYYYTGYNRCWKQKAPLSHGGKIFLYLHGYGLHGPNDMIRYCCTQKTVTAFEEKKRGIIMKISIEYCSR